MGWIEKIVDAGTVHACLHPTRDEVFHERVEPGSKWECDSCGVVWQYDGLVVGTNGSEQLFWVGAAEAFEISERVKTFDNVDEMAKAFDTVDGLDPAGRTWPQRELMRQAVEENRGYDRLVMGALLSTVKNQLDTALRIIWDDLVNGVAEMYGESAEVVDRKLHERPRDESNETSAPEGRAER